MIIMKNNNKFYNLKINNKMKLNKNIKNFIKLCFKRYKFFKKHYFYS